MKILTRLAARLLARRRVQTDRERIKAKARAMREEMGLKPLRALR